MTRHPQASGGVDAITTVLAELGPHLEPERLTALAPAFQRSTLQRLDGARASDRAT